MLTLHDAAGHALDVDRPLSGDAGSARAPLVNRLTFDPELLRQFGGGPEIVDGAL